jgi:hypothetical protein
VWENRYRAIEKAIDAFPAREREAYMSGWYRGGTREDATNESLRRYPDHSPDGGKMVSDKPEEKANVGIGDGVMTIKPAPMMRCEAAEKCEKPGCAHKVDHERMDGGCGHCYIPGGIRFAVCEPVEEKPRFAVGDRVRIARKAVHGEDGWQSTWIPGMDLAIGKTGHLRRNREEYGWEVASREEWSGCKFPESCLEKVEDKPAEECLCRMELQCPIHGNSKPPAEEEDIVRTFDGEWTREQYDDLRTLARRIAEPLEHRLDALEGGGSAVLLVKRGGYEEIDRRLSELETNVLKTKKEDAP